jgi:thiamine-phosphate pyrophosphorylase
LFCYITDRRQFSGDDSSQRRRLLEKIAEAARSGVDYIQLREKDLSVRELGTLAQEAVQIVSGIRPEAASPEQKTALLINSRTDVALAAGADGVQLRADDVSPLEVRRIWTCAQGDRPRPTIGVSCHSVFDVEEAELQQADFALLAPIFEKKGAQPTGLEALRQASRRKIRVLALGGITLENAAACLEVGASGIAAIRLFQENDIADVIRKLRQH